MKSAWEAAVGGVVPEGPTGRPSPAADRGNAGHPAPDAARDPACLFAPRRLGADGAGFPPAVRAARRGPRARNGRRRGRVASRRCLGPTRPGARRSTTGPTGSPAGRGRGRPVPSRPSPPSPGGCGKVTGADPPAICHRPSEKRGRAGRLAIRLLGGATSYKQGGRPRRLPLRRRHEPLRCASPVLRRAARHSRLRIATIPSFAK